MPKPNEDPQGTETGTKPEDKGSDTETGNVATESGKNPDNSEGTEGTEGDKKDWEAEAEKWKALARKHEDRAKENHEKVKAFDKIQEENMTDAEKAKARAEKAEEEASQLRRERTVDKALLAHGLTEDDREYLEALPVEKIDSAAKHIADRLKAAVPEPGVTTTADGKSKSGKPIGDGSRDIGQVEGEIAEARKKRDMATVIQLQNEKAYLVRKQRASN